MKTSYKLLALMVAMATGAASAATPTGTSAGTTAGTAITNTATATFTDPSTNTAGTSVTSNTVSTTVLPVTGFDIVYTDGSTDGTTASAPATSYDKTGILPGANVDTAYTVVNNSNIDNYVINLAPDTTGSANAPTSVKYYLASDTSFTTPITSVTVPVGGQVAIVQRMVIPTTAVVGTTYSASPHGTAPAGTVSGNAYSAVDESTNVNPPATSPVNSDLEFTKATIFTPTVANFPTVPTDPVNPTTPTTPGTTVVTPPTANPGTAGGGTPTNPVTNPGTPTDPLDPTGPGYTDPTSPSTAIVVSGNSQIAYPPADANTTPDVVTFNNVASTPVSGTTPAEAHLSLFPTDAGTVNNGNGTFTLPGGVTVSFTDTSGNPLPTWTNTDGKVYPYVTIPAGGGSVPYRTVVTYPDSNPNNNTTTVDSPAAVTVTVGADSSNDSDVTPNGTTTDTIKPDAAAFGDVPASGTVADRTLVGPANAAQVVVPGTTAASGAPSTGTATDSTAVFPMIIDNNGQYGDTYTLSGTVPIKNKDGTTTTVTVRYVDASGNPLPSGATAGTYITPLVSAGGNQTVYAIVDVPSTAAATTGTTGSNPNPVLTQTAVGNYSTITMTDVNDQIQVAYTGGITVVKTQSAAGAAYASGAQTAKPGQALNYKILATNTYNASVYNFMLSDPKTNNAFTTTTFVSASVALTGFSGQTPALVNVAAYYSIDNGASWSTTAPAAGTDLSVNGILVAVDTDNSGTITAADQVPAGATIELTINNTVK
ncbi:hypothetical protein MF271_10650 [Deinococcus sp. KNUC1210]|uniref:beta strand repeat-containing protein n=1 Tax=Deinococcus sp. KNUC1210 TaxID=2917691 RepID=UPI001EF0908F|nr:hypothetical protein [Deinococcus sp. KNUC1210]ULH14492.1 hypothetical protein MF271_10650 [Deinococcus sp. KNUC1210]